jgi:hypothetical protein
MNAAIRNTFLSLCLVLSLPFFGRTQSPSIHMQRTASTITIDGVLDESAWELSSPANNFWQYFPSDSVKAELQTEIYLTYDDEYLYIAAKCYAKHEDYIIPSLRRDYSAGGNDNISFLFDTFDDQTNAFLFGMNPYGVRREALISNGGGRLVDFSSSWDNQWYGESKIHEGYWVCELAIPFKTIRFKKGSKKWRFNSYRFDTQINERSTWNRIPRNQWIFNLAFMGDMYWDEPLEKVSRNVTVIPYATSSYSQDYEEINAEPEFHYDIGADIKIGINSGLNLDLTVNPDFSQVEVDRQVTDLSRFEIFFPERRQFFLENADLFSSFGSRRNSPFFSRRIGIAVDSADNLMQNPIQYGARLSGKLNEDWRIGLLNMQTDADQDINIPVLNYTVAALQRKVFTRSNIGMIFVNQQALNTDSVQVDETNYDAYNRVIGVDYNLASPNNVWTGEVYYHQAITPTETEDFKGTHGFHLNYKVNSVRAEWLHQYVGGGYDAQVGFVPRTNIFRMSPELEFYFYPRKKHLNQYSIGADYEILFQPEFGKTDETTTAFAKFNFSDNSQFNINVKQNYIYLTEEFDASGLDSIPLAANTEYNYFNLNFGFSSDRRKKIYFSIENNIGQYFNGTRYGAQGNVAFQFRPYGSIAFNYSYNHIELPEIASSLVLIGPRIDFTFTKKLFLTTFIQYNNQADNFNINARLQWRFKPVSDFFIVYTDNYLATDFSKKNRALVAKFTYWLNL